jgi:hypothetical protein
MKNPLVVLLTPSPNQRNNLASGAKIRSQRGGTAPRALYLMGTQVSDTGPAHFKNRKNLMTIVLIQTKVTRAKIEELKKSLPTCNIQWDGK